MKLAPHSEFGQTKSCPVVIHYKGEKIESETWDETLWIERGEDWYALLSPELKNKKVRIVERDIWLRSPEYKLIK